MSVDSFPVNVLDSYGNYKHVGKFSLNDPVMKVIQMYVRDQKIALSDVMLHFDRKQMSINKKLKNYVTNVSKRGITIKCAFKVRGGLNIGSVGPNPYSDQIQKPFIKDGAPYRCHDKGLNIEFFCESQNINVIGMLGYGKFDISKRKHIGKAHCPHFNVNCPNVKSIRNFWFNNCVVHFEAEMEDGTEIDITKEYGNKACRHKESATYTWMTMDVQPIGNYQRNNSHLS
mmetsp:Transcript_10390/g.12920  ORF Transcript_10390/g.12920 Transcript_10390/m.12920 type:complete len:229 (-) Transcript_10390:10-696(-)